MANRKSTYNNGNLNFKTPEEFEGYVNYIIEQNPNMHLDANTAAQLAGKMGATIDDVANDGKPRNVLEYDWNDEWSEKFTQPAKEDKPAERKKNSWEQGYNKVDVENYSNKGGNEQLIRDTYLAGNMTREEKEEAINKLKNKNSEKSLEAIKKGDTEGVKNAGQERTLLKGKTKTIDENGKEKKGVNLKHMSDYITYNMTDKEMNSQINAMTNILSSDKSDSSKWSDLTKYYNNATTISRQINSKIKGIKAATNLSSEEKTAIINALEEQKNRYVKVAQDAENKINSLGDLAWYEKLW